jgi:hypothetical protein
MGRAIFMVIFFRDLDFHLVALKNALINNTIYLLIKASFSQ